ASSRDAIALPMRPNPNNAMRLIAAKHTLLRRASATRRASFVSGAQAVERLDRIAGWKHGARECRLGDAEALVQHAFEQRAQIRGRAQVAAFVEIARRKPRPVRDDAPARDGAAG